MRRASILRVLQRCCHRRRLQYYETTPLSVFPTGFPTAPYVPLRYPINGFFNERIKSLKWVEKGWELSGDEYQGGRSLEAGLTY